MIGAAVYRERHLGARSIHRARAGVDKMGDFAVPALLQHLQEAEDVGGDIGVGALERVAYTCLGGEMDDAFEFGPVEQLIHRFGICKGGSDELATALLLQ